jgi:hypothetical protein
VTDPLAPEVLAQLAAAYRRDAARWRSAPRIAEVRGRLERARKAATGAAEVLGELHPTDLEVAGLDRGEVADTLDQLDRLATAVGAGLNDLQQRGSGAGGARRLPALYLPPPRFTLALRLAVLLERAGLPIGSGERGLLHDVALEVLTLAGEPEPGRGLPKILADVIRSRRNRAGNRSVRLCREEAA